MQSPPILVKDFTVSTDEECAELNQAIYDQYTSEV